MSSKTRNFNYDDDENTMRRNAKKGKPRLEKHIDKHKKLIYNIASSKRSEEDDYFDDLHYGYLNNKSKLR
jgi:hypothetical protein